MPSDLRREGQASSNPPARRKTLGTTTLAGRAPAPGAAAAGLRRPHGGDAARRERRQSAPERQGGGVLFSAEPPSPEASHGYPAIIGLTLTFHGSTSKLSRRVPAWSTASPEVCPRRSRTSSSPRRAGTCPPRRPAARPWRPLRRGCERRPPPPRATMESSRALLKTGRSVRTAPCGRMALFRCERK